MNKLKGFIFDLDGVIVDTAEYHYLTWRSLADDLNIPFTKAQNEQLKGVTRVESLKKILKWGNISLSPDRFNEIMNEKNVNYLSYISKLGEAEILPNVIETLKLLRREGQKIALGSASKNARAILEKVKLLDNFDVIVDGNTVSEAKPDPEVFLHAAKGLSIETEKCIVFEDSLAGIQAANTAGMISIGIGSSKILTKADYVFQDFREIPQDFIKELIDK